VLNTVIAWAYLIMIVKPDDIESIPVIVYERGLPVFGKRNITVIASSLLVILLFANFTYVKEMFGEIGIVAAIYVVFMFGSGILSEVMQILNPFFICRGFVAARRFPFHIIAYEQPITPTSAFHPTHQVDFNSLSWHTIFLVGGGNVLGKAVSSSGLLHYISAAITDSEFTPICLFT